MPLKRIPKQPTRPVDYVGSDELANELLMALKDVVAHQSTLSQHSNGTNGYGNSTNELEFQKLRLAINKVIDLHNRITARGLWLNETLEEASNKVDIDLLQLLEDCLRFPEIFPHAKNIQGLRKFFLCHCGKKEIADQKGVGLCNDCLGAALECIKEKKKDDRFILYTSYSPQVRCRHADFKTLLITLNKPGLWLPAWCEICLQQEKSRLT